MYLKRAGVSVGHGWLHGPTVHTSGLSPSTSGWCFPAWWLSGLPLKEARRPLTPQDFCVIFPATLVEKESLFYHLFHHTPKLGLKGRDQVPCLSWASLRSLGLWRSCWPGPFRCLPGAGVESALQNSAMGSLGWWGSLGNTKVLFSEKRWMHAGQAKTRQGKMQ